MTSFNIDLPNDYAVTSRDTFVSVDVAKLTPEIIAKLALHGLTQKVGDSAASAMADAGFKGMKFADLDETQQASVQALAKAAMAATVEALVKGEWTERREGAASVDPVVARVRSLFGAWLRANAKGVWAGNFKSLEADKRGPALDAFLADQDPAFGASFTEAAKDELAAEAKAKAKTAKLTIGLKL